MKKISIIIPVYNAEDYIEKCLFSIKKQTYNNYEIIIIDDGSKDNSLKKCEQFKYDNKNMSIKIVSQNNEGPSNARNNGIEKANGEYIMFVDADDYLDENILKNMLESFEPNVMVRSNYKTFTQNKIFENSREFGKIATNDFICKILDNSFPGCVWGCLFETKIIKEMKFSTKLHFLEDTLFLIEYLEKVKYVKFIEENYYYCLANGNSITLSNDRVLKNINSFCSALDEINIITKNKYIKLIDSKKIILIEKEMAKINKYNELKVIMDNDSFNQIISNIDKNNINKKIYLLLLNGYRKRNVLYIYTYIRCRKLLKTIKKLGE